LYLSVVLRPAEAWLAAAPESTGLITLAAGVAVAEGVRAAGGPTAEIKWPNDVVVGAGEPAFSTRPWRKLAGILAEGAATGDGLQHVVLGCGINVARVPYPAALRDQITSVEQETGRPMSRVVVLVETLAALARWYAAVAAGDTARVIARWRALSPSAHGAPVAWSDAEGLMAGVTAGVDPTGSLLVQTIRGDTHAIRSGEVRWL
jgi:BirA family transcriptional regulator, biotin operon repressor / biotin---[acetyl-CoA-carboxylase] ligase